MKAFGSEAHGLAAVMLAAGHNLRVAEAYFGDGVTDDERGECELPDPDDTAGTTPLGDRPADAPDPPPEDSR